MFLLIITVLTVWLFKVKRFRFLHETGVCMIYGMAIGFLIKYIGGENRVSITQPNCTITSPTKKLYISTVNGSQYSYALSGLVQKGSDQGSELEQKVHKSLHKSLQLKCP
ncbi:sodium:proton antiporter [Desmophyllum pertusum]|uniref:Sodium:proton antiporter n=1 Tax=Desmophyllum pertusum TaxID=174260 RepID=A0A9X0D8G8_9CNID|nr:sodium:proton antiporter [Desmophyllum pertusum]